MGCKGRHVMQGGYWCIGGSRGREGLLPPPRLAQNFFIIVQFSGKICQIIDSRPTPPGLAPPLGNPGSATVGGCRGTVRGMGFSDFCLWAPRCWASAAGLSALGKLVSAAKELFIFQIVLVLLNFSWSFCILFNIYFEIIEARKIGSVLVLPYRGLEIKTDSPFLHEADMQKCRKAW